MGKKKRSRSERKPAFAPVTVAEKTSPLWKSLPLHILLICVLGLLVYSNSFSVPFHFDDVSSIEKNPIVHDLRYFAHPSEARGLPYYSSLRQRYMGYLSFALNYRVHNTEVAGYHVVNLAIHILCALAVYVLVLLTFRTPFMESSRIKDQAPFIALFAATLFAAHPVQIQAVTYIVQRLASLATLFYLISMVCYAGFRLSGKKWQRISLYLLAILSAVLGMNTKQIAITLPIAVLMYELFFFWENIKKRAVILMPILVTILVIPLTMFSMKASLVNVTETDTLDQIDNIARVQNVQTSRPDYLMTESRVLVTYMRLILLPTNQNLDYDHPVYTSFTNPNVLFSSLFLGLIFISGIYLSIQASKKDPVLRLACLGIFWFFLTLSVESALVPLHPIYEHRLYLPMAGVVIGAAATLFLFIKGIKNTRARAASIVILLIAPLVLGTVSFNRNKVWQSSGTLWQDVLSKSPGKFRAPYNLGKLALQKDQLQEARRYLLRALEIEPSSGPAHDQLGLVYERTGDKTRAMEHYRRAIDLAPEHESSYINMGNLLSKQGKHGEAIAYFQQALKVDPFNSKAHCNLGVALKETGETEKAIHHYREAIAIDPRFTDAYMNLGNALTVTGDMDEAILSFMKARELSPSSALVRFNLANTYLREGEYEKAVEELQVAVRLDPSDTDSRYALASAWLMKEDYEKAIDGFKTLIQMDPGYDRAYITLALAYKQLGQVEQARRQVRKLLKIRPEHPLALQALRELN